MFKKIISHLKSGDLIDVTINYLRNYRYHNKIAEWRKLKENGETATIPVTDNAFLKIYTDSVLSEAIYIGRFENAELDFVKRYLRKDDVFLDIGANVGLFSVVGASIVGDTGHVYSFEPVKKTYERLIENIRLNNFKNVTGINAGLSDSNGALSMSTSNDGYDAWNSFGTPSAGSNYNKEELPVFSLDAWINEHNIKGANLIKIDVEGWEYKVLTGGEALFSSELAPDLLVEFTEKNCQSSGYSCGDLYDYLISFGYQLYTYDPANNSIIRDPKRSSYTHLNIVATKKPDHVSKRIKG